MARDYAQRGGNRRQQARGRGGGGSGGGMPGWIWLAAGLSMGLAVAAFVYVSRPPAQSLMPTEPVAQARPEATPGKSKSAAIPLPPKEKPRFTFYEILRDQEVVVPKEQVQSPAPPGAPKAAAGEGSFVIQVASYRSQAEAERRKASLALIGIESRIESITIDGKDTYYRVRIGPESNWSRVQGTMARLDENGIDALLIKLK
ncbi:SPOR domain-containing protein [Fontimonas sp. SYSU GA230001]|uniref:SPOR domain-containing protein n=1 Tax=Fontimonas sp. SYSU GA230001 TaxID=3142450 RepID=UPI0032B60903